jgi:hypothetical protein
MVLREQALLTKIASTELKREKTMAFEKNPERSSKSLSSVVEVKCCQSEIPMAYYGQAVRNPMIYVQGLEDRTMTFL